LQFTSYIFISGYLEFTNNNKVLEIAEKDIIEII